MKQSWYRIEDKTEASDEADVYVYDEIGMWGVTAKDFTSALSGVKAKTLNLYLNSPGGDVFDGMAIYNGLRNHPATVNVFVEGIAASAASFIAQAGDHITVEKASTMMIHDASGFAMGNAADMTKLADILEGISAQIAEIYADRAGGTVDEWRNRMLAESWYNGQEAVDIGLADELRVLKGKAKAENRVGIFNLSKFKNVPTWLASTVEDAGRPMSQSNLDRLHGAIDSLSAVHSATCDMEDCPIGNHVILKSENVLPKEEERNDPSEVIAAVNRALIEARMEVHS